ncbi:MAG: helix-turn-helix transcriptional regulator [Clostridia bacterium]|nr:helix-turn-helix transcriptional regulator [Clostridia bacterium]MBQ8369339.1 helix-turn-helix transcriptional regulator [Clostridia bacterium]
MSTVGENIKKYRTAQKKSQEDMAEALNVTRQTVSSWETGRTEPDIDTLHRISVYLDVTVEELIYSRRLFQSKGDVSVKVGGDTVKNGIGFGSALAMVVSYTAWESIGWAVLHGLFGWAYVIYYAVKYL